MRKFAVLAATVLLAGNTFAQVTQKGTVKLFNSGNTPLSGVQVMASGAAPSDTDGNGKFELTFPSLNAGSSISAPQAYKKGYELVNGSSLSWILSEKREIKLVMAELGTIEEAKNRYYNIAYGNYSKRYTDAIEELNREYNEGIIDANERKKTLDRLNTELNSYMEKLNEFTDKVARINRDDLSAVEAKAIELLDKGDMEGALAVYDDAQIVELASSKLKESIIAENDAATLAEAMMRYANLCDLAGGRENEAKATATYAKLAELFPDDFTCQVQYMFRKRNTSDVYEENDIKRVLELAGNDKSLTTVLYMMMNQEIYYGNMDKGMDLGVKVIDIISAPDASIESGDAAVSLYSIMESFGNIMEKINDKKGAIEIYLDLAKTLKEHMTGETNQKLLAVQTSLLANAYYKLADLMLATGNKKSSEYVMEFSKLVAGSEFFDTEEKLFNQYKITDLLSNYIFETGDRQEWKKSLAQTNAALKQLYEMKPAKYATSYFLAIVKDLLAEIEERSNPHMHNKITWFGNCVENEKGSLSESDYNKLKYLTEEMYVINYRMDGNEGAAEKHIMNIKESADWFYEADSYNNIVYTLNGYNYYLELLMKDPSQKETAYQIACALDALCSCADAQKMVYSGSARSNIATVMLQNGKYDIAMESLETIRKEREQHIRKNPEDLIMKANIASTYNNLSMAYSMRKMHKKAFEMGKKAIETTKPFYNTSARANYATNYFIMALNTSVYAYLSGDNDNAIKYIELMHSIATDLMGDNNFTQMQYITNLCIGDFGTRMGEKEGKELTEKILAYKKGTLQNDWLLLYVIDDYKRKGGIYTEEP